MLVVRKTKRYMNLLSLVLGVLVILSTEARAEMFGFVCVTNNILGDAEIGETQLSVDVTDPGSDQVLFTFHNDGPEASSITDIYLMDGGLTLNSIIEGLGVYFSEGATPGELPGYNADWTTFFTMDSEPQPGGVMADGINPGEWLGILFDIDFGYSYGEVITDMQSANLLVGIRVQGFDSGGSESLITPIPASVILGMLGLGVAGVKLRKYA